MNTDRHKPEQRDWEDTWTHNLNTGKQAKMWVYEPEYRQTNGSMYTSTGIYMGINASPQNLSIDQANTNLLKQPIQLKKV